MAYQKQKRAGLIDECKQAEVKGRLQNMQRVLRPVRIVNPYAPLIDLPKSVFKPRRTLPLLLSFYRIDYVLPPVPETREGR